ncbi:MAG: TnpV protein [Eubacteriales bacterium]|nr:TnpV protein [Eubacteriales bacterium]
MQNHIIDEKTGIPYTLIDDYYLPWGDLPDDNLDDRPIGIWGKRRLRFIKQHKEVFHTLLLTSGKLNDYLTDIDRQAEEIFSRLVKQLAERQGITEQLKASDQMAWVGKMNNIRNSVMEIINHNLIYG